jgi:hypothetical protein
MRQSTSAVVPDYEETGDIVFPGENINVRQMDSGVVREYIDTAIADGGGSPLVSLYIAVCARYRTGSDNGITTKVFRIIKRDADPNIGSEFWDSTKNKHYYAINVELVPMTLHTAAK